MNIRFTQLREDECCPADNDAYTTKYIGCIGVKTSMKSLMHKDRSEVAKESINRLCEANNIKRSRKVNHYENPISRMLESQPNLTHSGTDVILSVTSNHLNVISKETNQIIIQHEMPNVSFASSGDEDTVDFVAYVAKDDETGRACFVLECGSESAKNVLKTIAEGFKKRTQILCGPSPKNLNKSITHDRFSEFTNTMQLTDSLDASLDPNIRINNENRIDDKEVALTRAALEKEPWFHGSYLTREQSETRLTHDGDFLVRESMLEHGNFVLSVMHDGTKLHLLFDSIVRTKEMVFKDISHLIKFHHDRGWPIVKDQRKVYLRNGVRRPSPL